MANFPSSTLNIAVDAITAQAGKLSLHTANPSTTGASEVAGGSYARVSASWAASSGGVAHLASGATLNVPAGTTITHFGMWTSGGTWIGGGALSASEAYTGAGTYTLDTNTAITATSS